MHRNFNNWNKIKQYLQSCQQAFSKQCQIRSSVALQSQKWSWNVEKKQTFAILFSIKLNIWCCHVSGYIRSSQSKFKINYTFHCTGLTKMTENEEWEFHVGCYHGLTIKLYLYPCRLTHYVVIPFQIHILKWNYNLQCIVTEQKSAFFPFPPW